MNGTDKESIGKALGRVASGLYIVTVRQGERVNAFLGSWIQQCNFEPPIVSVAVKAGRPAQALLDDGGTFAVNILPAGEPALMKHFGRGFAPEQDPYEGLVVDKGITGVEILPDALAVLECKVVQSVSVADHVLYFGEVIAGGMRPDGGDPAIHVRKSGFSS